MREIRPSGSEGGVTLTPSSLPLSPAFTEALPGKKLCVGFASFFLLHFQYVSCGGKANKALDVRGVLPPAGRSALRDHRRKSPYGPGTRYVAPGLVAKLGPSYY